MSQPITHKVACRQTRILAIHTTHLTASLAYWHSFSLKTSGKCASSKVTLALELWSTHVGVQVGVHDTKLEAHSDQLRPTSSVIQKTNMEISMPIFISHNHNG